MLIKLMSGSEIIKTTSIPKLNRFETAADFQSNAKLSKLRKATYLIQPVGLVPNVADDLWLHMEFSFDSKKSEVVVDGWWVTDSSGLDVSLSKLSYTDLQFVAQAMTEEFEFHVKVYYDELESNYYEGGF